MWDLKENQELMDVMDSLDNVEIVVKMVCLDPRVFLVVACQNKDLLDHLVCLDHKETEAELA